jgi:heat-inducible transcriptional repressor
MLSQAARVLAQKTGLLSLVMTSTGELYYSGIGNLLHRNEFLNVDVTKNLFRRVEEINFWEEVLKQFYVSHEDILYILGEEDFRDPIFLTCSSIFGEFDTPTTKGIIGVIGPKNIVFADVASQVRYLSQLIEEILKTQNR